MKSAVDISLNSSDAYSRLSASGIAWPTIGLFGFLMVAGAANVWLALTGAIPLWGGMLINAVLLYVLEHVNHEAIHSNISGNHPNMRWLNDLIGHAGNFWMFLPFPAFKAVHLAHHRSPNHPTLDCDMWFASKTLLGVAARCSTLLLGYEIQLQRLARLGFVEAKTMRQIYFTRAIWVAVVGACIYFGFAREVLMLWVLPSLLAMPVLAFLFAYIVHYPHDSTERYKSSNVWLSHNPVLQKLLTTIFLFQNYHLVHHLHPRVPFYRYAKVFNEIRPQLEDKGAPLRYI